MAENTEANQLKGRRQAAVKAEASKPEEGNVTGSTAPVMVGTDQPARNYFMLGDPREQRSVLEASGGMYGEIVGDDYVVAETDAYEVIIPRGCKTGTTRMRWAKGQHVPIEMYRSWQKKQQEADAEKQATPSS